MGFRFGGTPLEDPRTDEMQALVNLTRSYTVPVLARTFWRHGVVTVPDPRDWLYGDPVPWPFPTWAARARPYDQARD